MYLTYKNAVCLKTLHTQGNAVSAFVPATVLHYSHSGDRLFGNAGTNVMMNYNHNNTIQ